MTAKRVALVVYVDLDPIPGPFHTAESAVNNLRGILEDVINHYNPTVDYAPDALQPENEGRKRQRPILPIIFPRWADADAILYQLREIMRVDGFATVAEFYRKCGQPTHFTDNYWGWNNLDGPDMIREEDGRYFLNLPSPKHLTSDEVGVKDA